MARRTSIDIIWPFVRIATTGLVVAAVVAQLVRTVERALVAETAHAGHLPTVITNFLSYFTIQSNIAAAVVLAIAAFWAWGRGRDADAEPHGLAIALVCVSTYMIVTGIVYNTLLRGVALDQGVTVPWSNEVLHVVVPVILLIDVLVAPRRRAVRWSAVGIVAVYPIAWAVYTLIRAPFIVAPATGNPYWYPYPFLDPHLVTGGYLGVAGYIAGIAIAIVGVGFLVVAAGRWRAGPLAAPPAAAADDDDEVMNG
ncbi:hypothetical protein Microterr_00630 [Microbacterium terricola]|uniref:Pr6Pr family membrane protein n=1 Tax=Microbacterium terricola TaxID=344163 RepID=A0ABM8DUW1_9MICO|nr:hypothetical protein Microterr_00630 [Microbacterium terricola]